MSKKYFGYGFQVKRTKEGAIILLIVIVLAIIIFSNWYNSRTVTNKINNLSYKTFFGVNEFKYKDCNKAYRINYKKNTCGTICIKEVVNNNNYLEELKESMEEDGFQFNNITTIKVGNETWNYLKTTDSDPIMNYYSINNEKYTYLIEYIDQTNSLDKKVSDKCQTIIDKVNDSIELGN